MLSSIYGKLASIFLSKLIPSIDTKQISVQNKDGLLSLENLEINPVLLIKAKMPFNIQRGIIKTMTISLSDQNESFLNRFQISLNEIYLYCDCKSQNLAKKDSQNLISNLKGIIDHFLSNFASSIGSLFDLTKIKIEAQNLHLILQNKENIINKTDNNFYSLLHTNISNILLEPIASENNPDTNKTQRNLRFSSISVSLYNVTNTFIIFKDDNILNISVEEFINSLNALFGNSDPAIQPNLFFDNFSISCQITSDNESTDAKIEFDPINVKSKVNQLSRFINKKVNKNQMIDKLWMKTYRNCLKLKSRHYLTVSTALSFLKNREKYLNLISTETDPNKLSNFIKESQIDTDTENCLRYYSNSIFSGKFKTSDQISSQSDPIINFSLTIPSVTVNFESINDQSNLTLKFDHITGKYCHDNRNNEGTFVINDFIINDRKISQSQPFLNAKDDRNGQVINLSKCLFVISKDYENDDTDKVDYLKMLDIEKQLSEYKMLIQMINLLGQSQMLNHFLLLGKQRRKMTFNGDSCFIQLQYFKKDESNAQKELPTFDFVISVNSFTIQFNKFRFEKAFIDFGGFNLNKNQILLPLKFTINSNRFLNSLDFTSELIEMKLNGPAFKKSIDIFKAIKSVFNIQQNIDLSINVNEIKIHLSVNLIVKCKSLSTKQKISFNNENFEIVNIFSLSFKEFEILDCNQLFLSFNSFRIKQKEVFINNLIFILNAPALNYIFSMFSFNKMHEKYKLIISNISVKLPFSEIVIFSLVDRLEYDGESHISVDRFSVKSSQLESNDDSLKNYIIDPISFVVNVSYDDNDLVISRLHLDQLNIITEPQEIKNILEVFSFFKNFLISKSINFETNWEFDLIKFSLIRSKTQKDNTIACVEINSFQCQISVIEDQFSLKIDCKKIIDSKEELYKCIKCKSPISLSFKEIDKKAEVTAVANNIDLFLSPELIMYYIDLNSFSTINLADIRFDIHFKNMNISFYSNNFDELICDIFETIHADEMNVNSLKKGNFQLFFNNLKSLSRAFELPSFDLQMINSVITYKMINNVVQIDTDSDKLQKFTKFFSEIHLNLPKFLTFGIDIYLSQVMINLSDTKQAISLSNFAMKVNALKKLTVISFEDMKYEGLLHFNNFLMIVHFHLNSEEEEKEEEKVDNLIDFEVEGDVLNPIHYECVDVLTKIDTFELTLNCALFQKYKEISKLTFLKMLKRRNNRWITKEIKLNLLSFEQELSFIFRGVETDFPFNDKQFHMKIKDADIMPNNLLTKKTSDDVFISIDYDFNDDKNGYLTVFIKESFVKLNINSFFTIYNLFASVNNHVPLSIKAEKMLISFDYENESPFHIYLDFKVFKDAEILYNKIDDQISIENKAAFEIESNVISMNFVERKPLVENMQFSLKIDNNRNLTLNVSDCSFLLSLFIRELIKSLVSQLKRMTFLFDKIIFDAKRRLLLNSVSITTGKITVIFCKFSFQPSYRITLSPFSTKLKSCHEENEEYGEFFDLYSSIDFMNEKINDWDYLVEPFKLSISPLLLIYKDDKEEGFYHYFKLKVNVNQNCEKSDNLNINLPLSILQDDDIFDQEERETFDKIYKKNKLFELPDLFIKNNLNTHVSVTITPQNTFFVMVSQQLLPLFIDNNPSTFEIKVFDKTIKFTLDEIVYPTIFSTCLSIVKRGRRIELNSPVQIQSCINKFSIDLFEKGDGEFVQLATLEPGKLYPMFFNSNKPKECLFLIENNQIKDKRPNTVLISPFEPVGNQNLTIVDDKKKYNLLIKVVNDKSGKIVKLNSAVICQNLLPFSVFIRIKGSKKENEAESDQFPICKNETADLLTVSPEIGSKFYAELSMNGIDYSSTNKLLIDLVPTIDLSMRQSSSANLLLDLNSESSLKSQTMTIFDCRIEKEIVINVRFEMLTNGQIKMILYSPFVFANLTDSDLMILNGNLVTHLPIHNWSILSPKTEGLIFTQKDDKIILSVDGFEKQEIQYNFTKKEQYFQTLFLRQEKVVEEEIPLDQQTPRRKSSVLDSLLQLFSQKSNEDESFSNSENLTLNGENEHMNYLPLRLKISRHKLSNEIVEMIISDLITIQNDTDIPIVFEFMSVLPHSTAKIKNIRKVHELSFHFAHSEVVKTISLDVLDHKLDKQNLKGDFKATFLIENDQKIEIDALNQEVNLLVIFKYSTFPTPLTITNELLDSNGQPMELTVYHTNPNKLLSIPPFTTSNFYYDNLHNLGTLNVLYNDKKTFKISLLSETGAVEIIDSQNNINFYVTVKMNHTKELLKSVIFTSKKYSKSKNAKDVNILNFFRLKVDLNVPSTMTSIIDINMNEILLLSQKSLSFSMDNKFDYNTLFMAFMNNSNNGKFMFNKYGIQSIVKCSMKSLQIDIQSNIIPRVFAPTIFKATGGKSGNDDNFLSFTIFANSTSKFLNAYLADSIEISSDQVSLSFFKKLLKNMNSKISIGKFDWFEISPFSFHFSYLNINNSTDGTMTRRRSSFSFGDTLNNSNQKSTTVSIPGIVFGQFDGNFLNEVLKIYLNKFIKPNLVASIPNMKIKIDKEDDEDDMITDIKIEGTDILTKKICENLTTSYGCINRSSLVSLALLLVNEKLKTPSHMMSIIAGLTSFAKNVKKYRNGFVFYFNEKDANNDNNKNDNENGKSESSEKEKQVNVDSPSNEQQSQQQQQQMQQWMRMPRCYPRFIIGNYDEEYSRVLILIRNRFRYKERVRMISKCTVTNDVIVLTDSYLIIVNPTLEYISNEISILEIQSVAIVENELRIAGKKESEKIMLRLDSEKTSKRFSIFIASQRLSIGMFGMSMIDK